MCRTWIAILVLASLAAAGDVKDAYAKATRKRSSEKKQFAAEQAAQHEGKVEGMGHVYLGLLWQLAQEWDKSVVAFRGYLAGAKPDAKGRPRALLEINSSQLSARKYGEAAATAQDFLKKHGGHAYVGRIRYGLGRALRAQDRLEEALESFRKGSQGFEACAYEAADCLVQLGRYADAATLAGETKTDAGRWKTLLTALPGFGKPMPQKLNAGFWAGRDLGMGEIKSKPALWSFWTMKVGNARDPIHTITNDIAARYAGKVHVLGATLYVQFDPVQMKSIPDMLKATEEDLVEAWKTQYELRYDLVILNDNALHEQCGVDPEHAALPAFAISDNKGRLRYVRVGPEEATTEAIDSMLRRLLKE